MLPIESTVNLNQFQAAVFDLDGTLVHSEHAWEAAKIEALAQHGLVPSRALLDAHVGRGLAGFLDEAFGQPLSPDQQGEIGDQIGRAADVLLPKMREPVAGAVELLTTLHEQGLRIAICSSSPRRHIVGALAMLGVSDRIETIVSGAELSKGKPDPLPYTVTLSALDLSPQTACAFEDSLPGAKSAFLAGMSVFAIGEGCTRSDFDFCHIRAKSFIDFGIGTLGMQARELHN